jgi:hypothetical protein
MGGRLVLANLPVAVAVTRLETVLEPRGEPIRHRLDLGKTGEEV